MSTWSATIPAASCLSDTDDVQSSIFSAGKFHNDGPAFKPSFGKAMKIMWRMLTKNTSHTRPSKPIEVLTLTCEQLLDAPDESVWRLGHSTVLLKLDGKFILTDPVFSERASPFKFIGPKRFHAPPIAREDLPEIELLILSHDHYDHLDRETVLALESRVRHFVAPLGVGDRLISWGIAPHKVRQLDWWQDVQIGAFNLIATPAQHFSGRGFFDRDSTLWASWVVITSRVKVFFSGDGGYFNGFSAIGERFGPFDLTMIETGAYNDEWPDIHMHPEQSLQAHLDLRGVQLLPIHNGTFDLSLHPWAEPFERITALAQDREVALCIPRIGERMEIRQPHAGEAWWRDGAHACSHNLIHAAHVSVAKPSIQGQSATPQNIEELNGISC